MFSSAFLTAFSIKSFAGSTNGLTSDSISRFFLS